MARNIRSSVREPIDEMVPAMVVGRCAINRRLERVRTAAPLGAGDRVAVLDVGTMGW